MRRCNVCWGILFSSALALTSCRTRQAEHELAQAQAQLLEASMKADSAGLVQVRQRLAGSLENESIANNDSLAARAHYLIAFAHWQMAFVTFNNAEGTKAMIADALAQLKYATTKKENLIDAYAVARRCQYWRFTLDPGTGKTVWPESQAALQKARSLAPEHPLVTLEEAIDLFYKPPQLGGDQQQGLARFQLAVERCAQWQQPDPAYKKWWQATACMFLGQAYLGMEKAEEAEGAFRAALVLQPNFEYVKSAMLPMTQLLTPPGIRAFHDVAWTFLASDAEGDGRNPAWAEAKALAYFYDEPADTLWFKLDLARLPNANAFGINLVVDTDRDQRNGAHWWGRNRAFKYDMLATVWVIKTTGGAFRGTAGIADARGVQLGRFTNLFRNNLAFCAQAENRVILLGLKSKDLDEDGDFDVIAAVGSNAGWNDDIPDSQAVTISLHHP